MITESRINRIIKRTINKVLNESAYKYEPAESEDEILSGCYEAISGIGRRLGKVVEKGLANTDDEGIRKIASLLDQILDISDAFSVQGNTKWERPELS